jgi:hypothetical protein
MPNGISSMATIAINEGRATRIADYADYSSRKKEPGERGYRAATHRGPHTLKASEAAARRGIALRKKMAEEGKMTHGGGGIHWGGAKQKRGQFAGGGAIYGKPYSKIRAKRKSYHPSPAGTSTREWKKVKPVSHQELAGRTLRTGERKKTGKGRKKRA